MQLMYMIIAYTVGLYYLKSVAGDLFPVTPEQVTFGKSAHQKP